MPDETRSIGALARESGLTISALRYYDAAGVLRPARVDPVTGYRRYAAGQVSEARLVAALRRVRMPLADIRAVLAAHHANQHAACAAGPQPASGADRQPACAADRPAACGADRQPACAADRHPDRQATRPDLQPDQEATPPDPIAILDRHLRRLEAGLDDARRQLAVARALLTTPEVTMTRCTVHAADLTAAIATVRFAVSADPELPALHGILFDLENDDLHLVATDRYRLATATVKVRGSGGAAQALVPAAELAGLEPAAGELTLELTSDGLAIGDRTIPAINAEFPDYRRLLPADQPTRVTVPTGDLRRQVATGPTRVLRQQPGDREHLVSVLRVAGGEVHVIDGDAPDAIGVNREFLLQALDAGHAGQLTLALDGPIQPLALLNPDRPGDLSLLMPVRLT